MIRILQDLHDNIQNDLLDFNYLNCKLEIENKFVSVDIDSSNFHVSICSHVEEPMHLQEILNVYAKLQMLSIKLQDKAEKKKPF